MKQSLGPRRAMALRGLIAGVALAAMPAASAQAAVVETGNCDGSSVSQPFTQWADAQSYELLPGGDFENAAAGWTLGGGARTVAGSEPFGLTGSVGSASLSLPAGSSAQSPFVCANAAYPTFRFLARQGGLLSSTLVQVVYTAPGLGQVAVPVGVAALSSSWRPTAPMLTASAVPAALSGGTTEVAIRFTELTGSSQIDDVFLDPRMKR